MTMYTLAEGLLFVHVRVRQHIQVARYPAWELKGSRFNSWLCPVAVTVVSLARNFTHIALVYLAV